MSNIIGLKQARELFFDSPTQSDVCLNTGSERSYGSFYPAGPVFQQDPAMRACRLSRQTYTYSTTSAAAARISEKVEIPYEYATRHSSTPSGNAVSLYFYSNNISAPDQVVTGFQLLTAPPIQPPSAKPPTIPVWALTPSVTRKVALSTAKKVLARGIPIVGNALVLRDAANAIGSYLSDHIPPDTPEGTTTPTGKIIIGLASEQIPVSTGGSSTDDNGGTGLPQVSFVDNSYIINNITQTALININNPAPSLEHKGILSLLAGALLKGAELLAREFASGVGSALESIASGIITGSQSAGLELLKALARDILSELAQTFDDGLGGGDPEYQSIDYDLLARAIRDGVSEALEGYTPSTPPAPPASETVISISESLEEKLDQYFTIPDTEAGLAEIISTNAFIFNPGYIP